MRLLEIESLEVGYGPFPVLHGISFGVEEGETAVGDVMGKIAPLDAVHHRPALVLRPGQIGPQGPGGGRHCGDQGQHRQQPAARETSAPRSGYGGRWSHGGFSLGTHSGESTNRQGWKEGGSLSAGAIITSPPRFVTRGSLPERGGRAEIPCRVAHRKGTGRGLGRFRVANEGRADDGGSSRRRGSGFQQSASCRLLDRRSRRRLGGLVHMLPPR
jgi:hypothetical protein